MRATTLVLITLSALVLVTSGCELLNPARPTIQPDTEVFGNVLDVEEMPDEPGVWTVRLRVAPPRALDRAESDQGREGPDAEKGLTAEIRIDADSVVLRDGLPALLEDINPGAEVVSIPAPGTTRMIGEKTVLHNAEFFSDFESYRRWRLPGLQSEVVPVIDDASVINTSGSEHSTVPLNGGRTMYFSGRLRRAAKGETTGAIRQGLQMPEGHKYVPERSFRTELGEGGWSAPEMVVFPDLEDAVQVSVSWVDPSETVCLVTVRSDAGERPWAGRSQRQDRGKTWGPVEALESLGEGDSFDPVYLAGSRTKVLFVTTRQGANQSDLFLLNPSESDEAMALEPRINTIGSEWGPRVGPDNELFFARGDRQLLFMGGMVQPVYLDWPHRVLFSEAAPTDDGRWVFLTITQLEAGEPNLDIWVSERREDGTLGFPVPVDGWRP
ncbi:MAG: hypothetical protein ABFS37_05130 [Acidobacteriota bacterium]